MTNQEMCSGLQQLGFNSGWVITGDKITVWENVETQPTSKQILDAAKLSNQTEQAKADLKASTRAAILDRLGLTAEEAAILLG